MQKWSVRSVARFDSEYADSECCDARSLRYRNLPFENRLLKESTLRAEKATQKKSIEEWARRLAEELSARARNIAEKEHKEGAVVVKDTLTEQVKQLIAYVTELKGKAVKSMETVADFNVKLVTTEKHAENVADEKNGLQICLQQSRQWHEKVCKSITRVQNTNDRFSAGLKEYRS